MRLRTPWIAGCALVGLLTLTAASPSKPVPLPAALSEQERLAAIAAVTSLLESVAHEPERFLVTMHQPESWGNYRLLLVQYLGILPTPRWIVAVERAAKNSALPLLPELPENFNRATAGAAFRLNHAPQVRAFSEQALALLAPSHRPVSRFSAAELQGLTPEIQNRLGRGWRIERRGDLWEVELFAKDPLARLHLWSLRLKNNGALASISRSELP